MPLLLLYHLTILHLLKIMPVLLFSELLDFVILAVFLLLEVFLGQVRGIFGLLGFVGFAIWFSGGGQILLPLNLLSQAVDLFIIEYGGRGKSRDLDLLFDLVDVLEFFRKLGLVRHFSHLFGFGLSYGWAQ